MGELAGPKGLTEGVWYDEWQQLKVTNATPFAAIAALPPKGAARKAPLQRELAGPKGLTEGFRGRQLRFYEIPGEYVVCSFRIVRIRQSLGKT